MPKTVLIRISDDDFAALHAKPVTRRTVTVLSIIGQPGFAPAASADIEQLLRTGKIVDVEIVFSVDPESDEHLQTEQGIQDEITSWLESLKATVRAVSVDSSRFRPTRKET